ncbi:MAG TPA: hypothetical protein VJQ79_00930 [Acidimicrobiia bacterium]|nr:hypothetical protein [Acidimicrobiia bacterium]
MDPREHQERVLAGLAFDVSSLGPEYELVGVDDPEALRSWFMPVVWSGSDEWVWTVVGQVAGFEMPVVVGKTDNEAVVCAGHDSGVMSCVGEGFRAVSDGEYSPAVWLVPELTEVVGFSEHDNTGWQIPSGGAVAFPRFHRSSSATLTAFNRDGGVVGQVEFGQVVEVNELFDQLPQPPTVDLVRALLERGVPSVSNAHIIDTSSSGEALLGIAQGLIVGFTHVDGSESYAIIVSDGIRGVAFWSVQRAALNSELAENIVAEDRNGYQSAEDGSRLIVLRGLSIQDVVDRWNASLDAP